MRKLIIILLGFSLISCSVEFKDNDGETITVEELKAKGKAIANAIEEVNAEFDEGKSTQPIKEVVSKETQNREIVDNSGIRFKHNGKEYGLDDYVHVKMEWAYFQGQTEAVTGDVRVIKQDGCWVWKASPWDGQSLNTVLYNPECDDVDVSAKEVVTEEVNFAEEEYDPYDTDF